MVAQTSQTPAGTFRLGAATGPIAVVGSRESDVFDAAPIGSTLEAANLLGL